MDTRKREFLCGKVHAVSEEISPRESRKLGQRAMRRLLRYFVKRTDGSVAIEFGILALPFFALMFAILETALLFFAGQVLETITADSSRLIMTGQAQTQGFNATQFRNAVCANTFGLFNCTTGIKIDVRKYTSFKDVNLAPPLDADGKLTDNFAYNPGEAGEIVVVRLFYQWPISFSSLGLSNMAGSNRLLVATAAFRNEPYNK